MDRLFRCRTAAAAVVIATLSTLTDEQTASAVEGRPVQEMISLPIQVVDAEGQPVAKAKVIPWALRCSQGHGLWQPNGLGGSEPPELTTDAEGRADVLYPRYAKLDERVRTTEVTLSIDHPEYAYEMYGNVDVPRTEPGAHLLKLQRGAVVELVPEEAGKPAAMEGLYAIWSDGRSFLPGVAPKVTDDGALRIPPMPAGKGEVLLVRLDGEKATHFSEFVDLELKDGEPVRKHVELRPAVRIAGMLSGNVPRPVKNGRLSFRTLPDESSGYDECEWFDWTPVAEDGAFVIESWPAGEALQLVALCDGFKAEPGKPPADGDKDGNSATVSRPQLFMPEELGGPLVIPMEALVRCDIEVVNETGTPLAEVKINSSPNVFWWYNASQIYCSPLASGEKSLLSRDYRASADKPYPQTFSTTTDANGHAVLYLPSDVDELSANRADYELPIERGRRRQEIQLIAGETTTLRLVMQPKGTDYLGEWDKLAGILFGCTGEECRRLLEDEGFRNKMTDVRLRLEKAENPADPSTLSDAFTEIADAFDELGDQEEVQVWRRKAAEQAAKLEAQKSRSDSLREQ